MTSSNMSSTPSMVAGKKRRGNKTLKSWVDFVKRVQHEESISYKDAMSRAKARKREWKHGGSDGDPMEIQTSTPLPPDEGETRHPPSPAEDEASSGEGETRHPPSSSGGRRRRRRTRRGGAPSTFGTKSIKGGRRRRTRKSRKSRKTRHRRR